MDTAAMYADCFLEYREATLNLDKHGAIVLEPRTQQPIDNPYLKVRDGALRKFQLRTLKAVRADWLWTP